MSYGYIVFSYANSNFLVPLEQFHIILNPDEILEEIGTNENDIDDVYFGNKLINIIHLSKYLNSESLKVSSSSRLLVGEFDGQLIGFWVDSINEIINIEHKKLKSLDLITKESFIKNVKIEEQHYNLINLNNIIKEKIELQSH